MVILEEKNKELSGHGISWPWWGLGLCFCSLFAFEASRQMWPPLDGDGAILFPPAVEFSLGRELKSPVWVWPLDESIDGAGGRRLVYHGFLYQMLVGGIAKIFGGGPLACMGVLHGLNVLASAVCSIAVLSWASPQVVFPRALAFLLPLQSFALSQAWPGRPEPLIALVLGLALMIYKNLGLTMGWVFSAGITPVLFFTSPAAGLLGSFILITFFPFLSNGSKIRYLFFAVLASTAVTSMMIAAYPFSIVDWIEGLRAHGKISFATPAFQGFVSAWLKRPDFPLALLVLGVPIAITLFVASQEARKTKGLEKVIFLGATLVSIIFLFRVSFLKAEAVYNATIFLPLWWALAWRECVGRCAAVLLLISGMPLVVGLGWKSAILLERAKGCVVSFGQLQKTIGEKTPEGVVVPPAFYLACPDPWKVSFANPDQAGGEGAKWLIAKQANTGLASPNKNPGFTLMSDQFGSPIHLLGAPISNTPKGWEFALYEKD